MYRFIPAFHDGFLAVLIVYKSGIYIKKPNILNACLTCLAMLFEHLREFNPQAGQG